MKNSSSYEHISPETIGAVRRFMLSEVSGKAAVIEKIKRLNEAQRYYHKMVGALTEAKREYHKAEIKCYLKPHEEPE